MQIVKLACEMPDHVDRSLSLWTCSELARTAKRDGLVESISPQTVQRILASQKLKPWRVHHWMSPKVERDAAFAGLSHTLAELDELLSTPHCSISTSATRSTPALPLFFRTRFHASNRTSLLLMWSYSA